jgi:hypothetical protein
MSRGHWDGLARYGLPGLMAGLILAWWVGGHGPAAKAQGMISGSDSNGMIAFTSPLNGTPSQLLYLIDTKSQNPAFAVYRVEPNNPKGSVKLEAARQYRYDLKLSEWNNQAPEVSSVEAMVGAVSKSK